MFIETERTPDDILIARRRPRSPEDPHVWAAHLFIGAPGRIQSETDRAKFLGRGNTVESADALRRPLSGSSGIVLDPIFSLRCRATVEPISQFELVLVTLIANSREELLALAAKYRRSESVSASLRNGLDPQSTRIPLSQHRPRQSPPLPGARQQSRLSQSVPAPPRRAAANETAWVNPRCGATAFPAISPCSP